MKRISILICLLIAGFVSWAQTYQLNYDSVKVGKNSSSATVLNGRVWFKGLTTGTAGDSVLTIVNGKVKKVPRSQFTAPSDLSAYQSLSEKGEASGYASLDGSGKVPLAQINDALLGTVSYQGNYDADTNDPELPEATGNKGKYYVVSVAGTQEGLTLAPGDWIISNGAIWQKVDNNNAVASVFGRTGAVTAQVGDYSSFYAPLTGSNQYIQNRTTYQPSNFNVTTGQMGNIKASGDIIENVNNTAVTFRINGVNRMGLSNITLFPSTTGLSLGSSANKWQDLFLNRNATILGKAIVGSETFPYSGNYTFNVVSSDQTAYFGADAPSDSQTGRAFAVGINGESQVRTLFYANGFIGFGSGSVTRDVFIGRSAVGTIKIGSTYNGGGTGNLEVSGTIGASNFSGSSSGTNTGDQDLSPYQTLANLSTDLTASATKYPSVNAVKTYADAKVVDGYSTSTTIAPSSARFNLINALKANLSGGNAFTGNQTFKNSTGLNVLRIGSTAEGSYDIGIDDRAISFNRFSSTQYSHKLRTFTATPSENIEWVLPDTSGTIALTSQIPIVVDTSVLMHKIGGTFTGLVNFNNIGALTSTTNATSNSAYHTITNTGGTYYFGVDDYVGSVFGQGSYALNIHTSNGTRPIVLSQAGDARITVNSSGNTVINGDISANNLESGTYTQTITDSTNVSSSSASGAHYMRVGNQVTVTGTFNVGVTAPSVNTILRMSLPIASNLTDINDLLGYGSSSEDATRIAFFAHPSTNTAIVYLKSGTVLSNQVINFTLMYTVK